MILTEAEAATKRCHESFPACQITSSNGATFSMALGGGVAYATASAPTHCIGSQCMAWRWIMDSDIHGYCGRAGEP